MPWYRLPGGGSAHLNMGRNRKIWPKHCQAPWEKDAKQWCCCIAEFQCDWKMPGGATCSKHLCKAHASVVAYGKHLCPDHRVAYNEWLAKKRDKADH